MPKVLGYKIIVELNPSKLTDEVNKSLEDGWEHLGRAFSVITNGLNYYYQTMICYAKRPQHVLLC